MLKGIDPLLSPEMLAVLAAMGHGDSIALVDANFPAHSIGANTTHGTPLRMDCDILRATRAVLSLMPVDDFGEHPVLSMQVVGDPQAIPPVVAEAAPIFAAEGAQIHAVERFAFYDATRAAFAIVQTTEARLYGNFIIRKGVIRPD